MNYLESITFINAATLPYAEIILDGNTLLSGKNGVGKTTILRAVLYFYGIHRSEQLGIPRAKKSPFDEYYFATSNSYLIYRYYNEHGSILAIAFKSGGGRVKFRFAMEQEVHNLQKLFFDGNIAYDPSELWGRLREAGYDLQSQTISSTEAYRRVLYGQDRTQLKYTFFHSNNEFAQIPKTLSNIFINSKLDSSSIKKSLVSSINGFSAIDMQQIHRTIDSFRSHYRDILHYEQSSAVLEAAMVTLHLYDEQSRSLLQTFAQLSSNAIFNEKQAVLLQEDENNVIEQLKATRIIFNQTRQAYQDTENTLKKESNILEHRIEETEAKLKDYQNKHIDEKLRQAENKPLLETQLANFKKQYEILTEKQKALTERFEQLKQSEKQSFNQTIQIIQTEINILNSTFNDTITILNHDRENVLDNSKQKHSEKKKILIEATNKADKAKIEAEKETIRITGIRYFEQEIKQAENEFLKSKETLNLINSTIREAQTSIEIQTANIQTIELNQKHLIEQLSSRIEKERIKFIEIIEVQRKRLNSNENSFLGFLRGEKYKYEGAIATLLKDEILFSETLNPFITKEHSETFYGINIDISQLNASDYATDVIKGKIADAEQNIKRLEEQYDDEKVSIENTTRNNLNSLARERRKVEELIKTQQLLQPKQELAMHRHQENIASLQKDAELQRQSAIELNNKQITSCKQQLLLAQEQQNSYETQVKNEEIAIKTDYTTRRIELDTQLKINLASKQTTLDEITQQHKLSLESIEKDEHQSLESEGVDLLLLQSFTSKIATLQNELDGITSNAKLIQEYCIDKERLFDPFADNKAKLLLLQQEYQERHAQFLKVEQAFNEKKDLLENQKNHITQKSMIINNDLEKYRAFKNSSFWQDNNYDDLPYNDKKLQILIDEIQELTITISKNKEELRKKITHFFNKFSQNNIFAFEIPNTDDELGLLISARQLQVFVHEAKIDVFKGEVAKQFGLTLRHLSTDTKELLNSESEISKTISKINRTLQDLQGIKVIEKVELRFQECNNQILNTLKKIMQLHNDQPFGNEVNLFTLHENKNDYNQELLKLLDELSKYLENDSKDQLTLEDTFVLEFRAIENGNDSGFVISLDGVGSNGTDVMVKAMVNIAMLSLVRKVSGKEKDGVYFHCIMDEIGILHPEYLKELIEYANNKQIRFLNGAPDEKLVTTYKRLYMLSTNAKHQTLVRRLVTQL